MSKKTKTKEEAMQNFFNDLISLVDKHGEVESSDIIEHLMLVAFHVMTETAPSIEVGKKAFHEIIDHLGELDWEIDGDEDELLDSLADDATSSD